MRRAWISLLVLALAGSALSGCLATDESELDDHQDDGAHPGEQAELATPPDGPIEVRLEAETGTRENELGIMPERLEIPAGKNVELTVRNNGKAPHTFTVHGYGLDTGRLQAGGSKTFTFRTDKEGAFEIMCDEAGHYDAGMKATLVVRDDHGGDEDASHA